MNQTIFQEFAQEQDSFNRAYRQHWDTNVQALFAGDAGFSGAPLSDADRESLLSKLFAQGYVLSNIEIFNLDPFWSMKNAQANGATWIKGASSIAAAIADGPLYGTGPVPAGGILVSTNPADYPPYVPPTPDTPSVPPIPQSANPVGKHIFGNYYQCAYPCTATENPDGYAIGATWTGSVNGVTGTWTKIAVSAGMAIWWEKTA